MSQPNYDNDRKNPVRTLALSRRCRSNNAILFPGENMFCLDEGCQSGLFDPRTTMMICIEQNRAKAKRIEGGLQEWGFKNSYVHRGQADKLHADDLNFVLGNRKVDYAFFDFCGQLTLELFQWGFIHLADVFAPKATVAFTFALQTRNQYNLVLGALNKSRLSYCVDLDTIDIEVEDKFRGRYANDQQATIAGVWAMLAANYDVEITHARGYTSSKTPMLMVKAKIHSKKPSLDKEHVVNVIELADGLTPMPSTISDSAPDWQRLECHPAMSTSMKRRFVREAKQGICPPWFKPKTGQKGNARWTWHSLNPTGRRVA